MEAKFQWVRAFVWQLFHLPCLVHTLTGWYCPGCGGTRAVKALLRGQIGESFRYHPLVVYAAAVILVELMSAVLARLSHRSRWYLGHENLFAYVGCGIALVNWIVKNVMLARGVDLLAG